MNQTGIGLASTCGVAAIYLSTSLAHAQASTVVYDDVKDVIEDLIQQEVAESVTPRIACYSQNGLLRYYPRSLQLFYERNLAGVSNELRAETADMAGNYAFHIADSLIDAEGRPKKLATFLGVDPWITRKTEKLLWLEKGEDPNDTCSREVREEGGPFHYWVQRRGTPEHAQSPLQQCLTAQQDGPKAVACAFGMSVRAAVAGEAPVAREHVRRMLAVLVADKLQKALGLPDETDNLRTSIREFIDAEMPEHLRNVWYQLLSLDEARLASLTENRLANVLRADAAPEALVAFAHRYGRRIRIRVMFSVTDPRDPRKTLNKTRELSDVAGIQSALKAAPIGVSDAAMEQLVKAVLNCQADSIDTCVGSTPVEDVTISVEDRDSNGEYQLEFVITKMPGSGLLDFEGPAKLAAGQLSKMFAWKDAVETTLGGITRGVMPPPASLRILRQLFALRQQWASLKVEGARFSLVEMLKLLAGPGGAIDVFCSNENDVPECGQLGRLNRVLGRYTDFTALLEAADRGDSREVAVQALMAVFRADRHLVGDNELARSCEKQIKLAKAALGDPDADSSKSVQDSTKDVQESGSTLVDTRECTKRLDLYGRFAVTMVSYILSFEDGEVPTAATRQAFKKAALDLLRERGQRGGIDRPWYANAIFPKFSLRGSWSGGYVSADGDGFRYQPAVEWGTLRIAESRRETSYFAIQFVPFNLLAGLTELALRDPEPKYHHEGWLLMAPAQLGLEVVFGIPALSNHLLLFAGTAYRSVVPIQKPDGEYEYSTPFRPPAGIQSEDQFYSRFWESSFGIRYVP